MKSVKFMLRIALFSVILTVGTATTMLVGETESSALVDLSQATIQAVTTGPDDNYLLAGFTGGPQPTGLARSTDGGHRWEIIGSGPGMAINALALAPNDDTLLFAGTGRNADATQAGLWYSQDAGQTWSRMAVDLPRGVNGLIPNITALAVDPTPPAALYVGTEGQGAYRFALGATGFGYELVSGVGSKGLYVTDIAVDVNGRAYVLTTDGTFVINSRSTTEMTTLHDQAISLAIDPDDPDKLYAGTVGYGAYRSEDRGQTWRSINEGLGWQPGVLLRVSAIAVDEANPSHIAAATAISVGSRLDPVGIYESFDGGENWQKLVELEQPVNDLLIHNGIVQTPNAPHLTHLPTPSETTSPSWLGWEALGQLNPMQFLTLSLTTLLAALVLIGRFDWATQPQPVKV